MRLLLAMMKHETNTFSPVVTDLARFRAWGLYEGADVLRAYRGTNHPLAAFIDLAEEAGAEIVTPVAAEAMPSGLVRREAYDYLTGKILDALRNDGPFDAALLDLHGAMVAEDAWDGEGFFLERMRAIAPDLPIAVTFDMHGNITERLAENVTLFNCYKSYPHTDMYETGRVVGRIMLDALAGRCKPVMAFRRVPVLAQTLRMGTADEPMRTLQQMTREEEADPAILCASVFGGFPMADIPKAGMSVIVIADGDRAAASRSADRLADAAWAAREEFLYRHEPLAEAVARAKEITEFPCVLLDHADNVGSGGTSDSMVVLREILRQGLTGVAVGAVWDPEAVQTMMKAGVGAEITLDLGGKTEMPSVGHTPEPLRLTGRVRRLSDGEWIIRGPMYTGTRVTTGPTALFETQGVEIVVTTYHHEPWDAGIFTSVGIDPAHVKYILLKSRIHYRAGFSPFEKTRITLDGEGVTTSDNSILTYENFEESLFPIDPLARWPRN